MKKIFIILALMMCTALGFAQADKKAGDLVPPGDGEDWRKLTSTEKLYWSVGYAQGYQDALFKIDVASGPESECARLALRTERTTATAGKMTGFEVVSGLEKFYSDSANTFVPLGHAVRIYLLQASGKDQVTIQELIETARSLGAERARSSGAGGR